MTAKYFCSQKFDWLEVRLYDGHVASCCKSSTDKLTRPLLAQDPQAFFNWPAVLAERQQMLTDQPVLGCDASCWKPESQGLVSRRLKQASMDPKPFERGGIRRLPKTVNLVVNNTCSLTCSYCCKNYSSSWNHDIVVNGDYGIPGYESRYNASAHDRILHQLTQPRLDQSAIGLDILAQLEANREAIEEIIIIGGEPLLYSNIEKIVEMFSDKRITIFSGLGTTVSRLQKLMPIMKRSHVRFKISAENIGALHEFNRYGSRYQQFKNNFDLVSTHCPTSFWSVINNLTLFGFADFFKTNAQYQIETDIGYEPEFMRPNVMDDVSKELVIDTLQPWLHLSNVQSIIDAIALPYDPQQQQQLGMFLNRFTKTRSLSLDIFPQSFREWATTGTNQS